METSLRSLVSGFGAAKRGHHVRVQSDRVRIHRIPSAHEAHRTFRLEAWSSPVEEASEACQP